jgi:hypothetical protein
MDGLLKTREEVVDIQFAVAALMRKAQCRQVNCDVIDMLEKARRELLSIENELTIIIGD